MRHAYTHTNTLSPTFAHTHTHANKQTNKYTYYTSHIYKYTNREQWTQRTKHIISGIKRDEEIFSVRLLNLQDWNPTTTTKNRRRVAKETKVSAQCNTLDKQASKQQT